MKRGGRGDEVINVFFTRLHGKWGAPCKEPCKALFPFYKCYGHHIWLSETFWHFFSEKNFLVDLDHFSGLQTQKTCFQPSLGLYTGIQPNLPSHSLHSKSVIFDFEVFSRFTILLAKVKKNFRFSLCRLMKHKHYFSV